MTKNNSIKADFEAGRKIVIGLLLSGNIFFVSKLVDKVDNTSEGLTEFKYEIASGQAEVKQEIVGLKREVSRINDLLKDMATTNRRHAKPEDAAYWQEKLVLPYSRLAKPNSF